MLVSSSAAMLVLSGAGGTDATGAMATTVVAESGERLRCRLKGDPASEREGLGATWSRWWVVCGWWRE